MQPSPATEKSNFSATRRNNSGCQHYNRVGESVESRFPRFGWREAGPLSERSGHVTMAGKSGSGCNPRETQPGIAKQPYPTAAKPCPTPRETSIKPDRPEVLRVLHISILIYCYKETIQTISAGTIIAKRPRLREARLREVANELALPLQEKNGLPRPLCGLAMTGRISYSRSARYFLPQ